LPNGYPTDYIIWQINREEMVPYQQQEKNDIKDDDAQEGVSVIPTREKL